MRRALVSDFLDKACWFGPERASGAASGDFVGEDKLLGTSDEEHEWPVSALDTSDGGRQGQSDTPILGTAMSKERWSAYADVPARLSVQLPLPRLSLKDLLELKPGTLLCSELQISQDVSLLVGDVFFAFVSCEPAGERLGVRINGFEQSTNAL